MDGDLRGVRLMATVSATAFFTKTILAHPGGGWVGGVHSWPVSACEGALMACVGALMEGALMACVGGVHSRERKVAHRASSPHVRFLQGALKSGMGPE